MSDAGHRDLHERDRGDVFDFRLTKDKTRAVITIERGESVYWAPMTRGELSNFIVCANVALAEMRDSKGE